MKYKNLKQRLDKDPPMTTITMRIPDEAIEELKRITPVFGFSGYQTLMHTYIGQGLRSDLEKRENDNVSIFIESLKRHGASDDIIRTFLIKSCSNSLSKQVSIVR